MKTIAKFRETEEAHLFRSYLSSNGVEAHVFDEHVVQLFWHYSDAIGGVRVVVEDEESETATNLAKKYYDELNSERPIERTARIWPIALLISIFVGLPCLIFGRHKKSN